MFSLELAESIEKKCKELQELESKILAIEATKKRLREEVKQQIAKIEALQKQTEQLRAHLVRLQTGYNTTVHTPWKALRFSSPRNSIR
jgi:multidrug resistance efflux pump